ncbi:hypothetical protein GCM10027404_33160 [Arthrobacter tumbae]|uniref:MarR family winged helix-turn-helix transcriptional regulator n=1 Tax=Arthrobacter tumbae TaxID=163874 RepID=UPI00195D445A|nr:MarR family transcriptional regulator [Arthrobacter tumbae]MBM7781794.1 DNA-binding MarR family transcriptional regulator [Arthrobacter tumbae]
MEMDTWSVSRLLSTAARLNERYDNERLGAHGITHAGMTLLRVLDVREAISQARLAALLHIQPQTAGKTLARLELRGLVQRDRTEDDRRLTLVKLTPSGHDLLAALDAEERQLEESTGLSDEDLRNALQSIIASLRPDAFHTNHEPALGETPGPDPLLALLR